MWPSVLIADGAFEVVLTKSLASVLWIASGFLVSRLLDRFLWNGLLTREGQPIVAKVLSDLCSAAVYLAAACALFHFVFEVNVATIAVTSGFLALLLGYSAQNSLSDFFAGVGLNLARQFRIGDWIGIEEHFGVVIEMNWRFVALETLYQNILTVPHSVVAQAKVINYHRPHHHRGVILPVLVEAGAELNKVRSILVECKRLCEEVEKEPTPEAALSEFQDSGVLYELWYYTKEPDDWDIRNDILCMIWDRFREEDIGISLSEVRIMGSQHAPAARIHAIDEPIRRLARPGLADRGSAKSLQASWTQTRDPTGPNGQLRVAIEGISPHLRRQAWRDSLT